MLVFVDSEFTDFVQMDLISIALVAEDGGAFYAERTDYRRDDCSDFVRAAVLPMEAALQLRKPVGSSSAIAAVGTITEQCRQCSL